MFARRMGDEAFASIVDCASRAGCGGVVVGVLMDRPTYSFSVDVNQFCLPTVSRLMGVFISRGQENHTYTISLRKLCLIELYINGLQARNLNSNVLAIIRRKKNICLQSETSTEKYYQRSLKQKKL